MKYQRLEELFEKYLGETITQGEIMELQQLVQKDESTEMLDEILKKAYSDPSFSVRTDYDVNEVFAELMEKAGNTAAPVIAITRTAVWKRWAVAAAVLLVIGAVWWMAGRRTVHEPSITVAQTNDVKAPAITRATITLADGTHIYLDSAGNGTLVEQGKVNIVKSGEGEVLYQSKGVAAGPEQYNSLVNPRGSKAVSLTLSDGTKVWLNAESSLKYPVAFTGTNRRVEITGEAYFEVAHDAAKPFVVSKGETNVQVLGTHFNVNAYEEEASIKVTLLEGIVKVANRAGFVFIKPGEQATLTPDSKPQTANSIDLDEVMAWKNGRFSFVNADLKSIMRQLMRWYDVDVVYAADVPQRNFTADISRDKSLAGILKILEESNIHFKVEGKKIVVMP